MSPLWWARLEEYDKCTRLNTRIAVFLYEDFVACSHRRHGQDTTILCRPCLPCEHNYRPDKTVLSCLCRRLGGVNKLLRTTTSVKSRGAIIVEISYAVGSVGSPTLASKLIWIILILKVILYMILIWYCLENSDFDFDFKSFLERRFWFWFEIVLDMVLLNTARGSEHCLDPLAVLGKTVSSGGSEGSTGPCPQSSYHR